MKWFPAFTGTTPGFRVVFYSPGMMILHEGSSDELQFISLTLFLFSLGAYSAYLDVTKRS